MCHQVKGDGFYFCIERLLNEFLNIYGVVEKLAANKLSFISSVI